MNLDRDDLEVVLSIVRQHLRSPAPNMTAYRLAHRLETALDEGTSANGSPDSGVRDTEWERHWATTTEAAQLLGTTERWARELARSGSVGAIKRGGRWWLPRDALPEPED